MRSSVFSPGKRPKNDSSWRLNCKNQYRALSATIGLKVLDLRPIYLFIKQLYRDVRCLKCSTVHNGAALSPAKLPQSESASPPTLLFLWKANSQIRNYKNTCKNLSIGNILSLFPFFLTSICLQRKPQKTRSPCPRQSSATFLIQSISMFGKRMATLFWYL